ncbi:uncharacterized protein LOC119616765 isoform X2 [Kryptolebias marmoratus]|uniref:uncharacterized protein LOC119616765 isoform X2 n=1 Tax=Kryptolebias marmoratus TaxID=37003 RepID=UPI0018ACC914|nr:uncharacterized protein LOC119616765 isoform X2 [Kryptolebias marmoratus]
MAENVITKPFGLVLIVTAHMVFSVPSVSTKLPKPGGSSSFFTSRVVTVLMVSPLMLLVALLPFFMCCIMKTKDRQKDEEQQRASNPTVQETIEESNNVAGPSLVYSILDFPKRPPAAVELRHCGPEYATVSYLTDKRQSAHTDECKPHDRSCLQ